MTTSATGQGRRDPRLGARSGSTTRPALTALDIRSRARRLQVENNIGLVIIDYLQLMQGPSDSENRQQEISYISRSLKILSRELEFPVIALSQLSRAPEQRSGENRRPQLSDLRESGAIEQDADVVMFLYRPEYYEGTHDERGEPRRLADGTPLEGLAEVIIGKQRNGPTDTVRLYFHKKYTRFDSYTPATASDRSHAGRSIGARECGAEHPSGRGAAMLCGEWNTLAEEVVTPAPEAIRRRTGRATAAASAAAPPCAWRDVHGSGDRARLTQRHRRTRLRARRRHRPRAP